MIDLIIVFLILAFIVYVLIVLQYETPSYTKPKKLDQDDKFEPVDIVIKTLKEDSTYRFKHQKISKRNKPYKKEYFTTKKVLFVSLNKILRHFALTENPKKSEILKLTYIPDDFDFVKFSNNRNVFDSFSEFQDTKDQIQFLPNDLAKVADELNEVINEAGDSKEPEPGNQVTFKKNKVTLLTSDGYYLNVKFTTFPKPEYDVGAISNNIIESVLILKKVKVAVSKGHNKEKKRYIYYLKFSNGYYLCINKNGILYGGKDKNFIFYFDIVPLNKKNFFIDTE